MEDKQKKRFFSFLQTKWDGSPRFEAFRFVIIYVLVGILWILFSDKLLLLLVNDQDAFVGAQLIKGIFYVLMTGLMFYAILKARLQMLRDLSQEIVYQATHDKLTNIPNKEEFGRRLNQRIKLKRNNEAIALVFLDVDNFSNINELMDYTVGDELLIEMKDEIIRLIPSNEIIGRDDGGFVFTITHELGNKEVVDDLLIKILTRINQQWEVQENKILVTCSIGVSLFPKDGQNFNELYRAADIVMHDVKENRRNTFAYFEPDYIVKRFEKIDMIHEIKRAVDEERLSMVYQPIYRLGDQVVVGYEALLRWNSQTYGQVPPNIFIPYSENMGTFHKIEEWVFTQAIDIIKQWNTLNDTTTILSVNLSSSGLSSAEFIQNIKNMMELHLTNPQQLQIEVTETALIENIDRAIDHLHQLKALGCWIALDDFGTGYSSLMYLQKLPIDTVKIDKVFTNRITANQKEDLVFMSLLELSKKLGLKIVIEGVETEDQHDYLLSLSAQYGQGYFYNPPLSEEKMLQYVFEFNKNSLV